MELKKIENFVLYLKNTNQTVNQSHCAMKYISVAIFVLLTLPIHSQVLSGWKANPEKANIYIKLNADSVAYPPPDCVEYENGQLMICPPDTIPGNPPPVVMGYNIYVDSYFEDFLAVSYPLDTVYYLFTELPAPGDRSFCVATVYNEWISEPACDSAHLRYGFPLPFLEDWNSMSFDTNLWQHDTFWSISNDLGNPEPSAMFQGGSLVTNYSKELESYPFLADSMFVGQIFMDFSLTLNSVNSTGDEKLLVQVWRWDEDPTQWHTIAAYNNANGNISWTTEHVKITSYALSNVIKIRFVAEGMNLSDIGSWLVDNVHLNRTCDAPYDLHVMTYFNNIELVWIPTICGTFPLQWLHYDLGTNFTSIGTGSAVEFDAAARWTPAQLIDLEGHNIYEIAFFPAEEQAIYKVRIWEGANASLVYEQDVNDPVIDSWNYILLDTIHPIDINQELWIGYHIQTLTGYPAGCDQGPAVNGYGNMMFWEDQWQTLLQINPDLDYNWNIQARYIDPPPPVLICMNRIYRQINQGEYLLLDEIPHYWKYTDTSANLLDLNCYKVTTVWTKGGDTCESDYTNEACVSAIGIPEDQEINSTRVQPNPLSTSTTIEYELSESGKVSLIIYNHLGQQIETLVSEYQSQGRHQVIWNAEDLPSGIYFYRLQAGVQSVIGKMMVVR